MEKRERERDRQTKPGRPLPPALRRQRQVNLSSRPAWYTKSSPGTVKATQKSPILKTNKKRCKNKFASESYYLIDYLS